MPHVVLETHTPLYRIVERVEPFVVEEEGTVWRMRDVFLNRDDSHALAECLVVVGAWPERFFVHLAQREQDGAIVVRPYPVPRVDVRPSVKRMVALVAEALASVDPDTRISRSTIDEFLSARWTWRPDPEPSEWDPMLPLRGLPRPLDWSVVFGSAGPVEIEIGSGKGSFLVESAKARPGHRFLSIEWALPYAEHLRDRVRRRGFENVRIARADAARFLGEHVPPGSVRVLHVYFPDPWPKKRHHKRRLMQPGFVAAAAEALEQGGELRFVSDHAEYFEEAREVLSAEPALEEAPVLEEEMTDLTNYERKYRAEGRPIHRTRFVKR
ncbi:MAG TPA: tRNA (guanosine(46)-N7)-methyltransferase TrmB [Gemmatimonadota bacterium]|nr:tRNA (guanosine(46)-N7)-methyltransferase TrmB [Gemmatimonadota bacterium]